jgi:hypothetical protein
VKRSIIASAIALFVYVVIDPELVEGEEPLYFALAVVCFLSPKERWPIAAKRKNSQKPQQNRLSSPKTTQLISDQQHARGILVRVNSLYWI